MKTRKNMYIPACLACLLAMSVATAPLRADYASWNTDPNTLQINEGSLDNNSLYKLFNEYFADYLETPYTSGDELYADRGVKDVVANWTVGEGARIESSFKSAMNGHTLSLIDQSGNTVYSHDFAQSQFDTMLGGEMIFLTEAGLYNFSLDTWYNSNTEITDSFSGADPTLNAGNVIHMVAFDVTDLVRAMYDDMDIESAYLFGWEDLPYDNWYADFDYQDLAYIMINVKPNVAAATPEPATALILALGAAVGLPLWRRKFRGNTR